MYSRPPSTPPQLERRQYACSWSRRNRFVKREASTHGTRWSTNAAWNSVENVLYAKYRGLLAVPQDCGSLPCPPDQGLMCGVLFVWPTLVEVTTFARIAQPLPWRLMWSPRSVTTWYVHLVGGAARSREAAGHLPDRRGPIPDELARTGIRVTVHYYTSPSLCAECDIRSP
jgi:hypothetical protein